MGVGSDSINAFGFTIGSVDGVASVQSALDTYNNSSTIANQLAYDAAIANAEASETAPIPLTGMVFASAAITADLKAIAASPSGFSTGDLVSLANNFVNMAAGGLTFMEAAGVEAAELTFGGVTFSVGQVTDFIGNMLTAAGVSFDESSISSYVSSSVQSLGLSANSDGTYNVTATSDSELICNPDNAMTLFETAVGDNTLDLNSGNGTTSSTSLNQSNADIYLNYMGYTGNYVAGVGPNTYGFTVTGSNNDVYSTGDIVTLIGSGNDVTADAGSSVSLNGTSDTVNASNSSSINLDANSQATITFGYDSEGSGSDGSSGSGAGSSGAASGGSVNGTAGDNVSVIGSDITLSATGGQYSLTGTGDIADASNSTISLGADTQASIAGTNDNVSAATGDVIDLSNATITLTADSSITIDGSNDTIIGAQSDDITIAGQGDSVSATDATIVLGDDSSASVSGSESTVVLGNDSAANITGSNDVADLIDNDSGSSVNLFGTGEQVNSTDNLINIWDSGDSATINGANSVVLYSTDQTVDLNSPGDVVYSTTDATGESITGTEDTIALGDDSSVSLIGSESTVVLSSDSAANITGSNDVADLTDNDSGSSVNLFGTGEQVNSTDNLINIWNSGDSATINGANSVVLYSTDQTVDLNSAGDMLYTTNNATGEAITGNDDTIDTGSGFSGNVAGSYDTINLGGSGDYLGLLGGLGYEVVGSGDTVDTLSDTGVEIDGSSDLIGAGADSAVISDGNGNFLNGDAVSDGDSYSTNDSDDVFGGGDDNGDGSYGYYGYYGFAGKRSVVNAALGSNIGSIAQHDLALGNQAGADTAEKALSQAQGMAASTPTSGTGTAVDSGNKWASGEVITWSLATDIGTQYSADVQQAIATWATASGITFEEVSGSTDADIQIGFSDLGTATTGVVGYTTFAAKGGQIAEAVIQLEDPSQDALVPEANGQLTYSDTDATLSQTLLHEIGHALGLADDSDKNSIMYYEMTSDNQTLDSTDIAGIQLLYGGAGSAHKSGANAVATASTTGATGQTSVDHQLNQLIASMASFNSPSAADTHVTRDEHVHQVWNNETSASEPLTRCR